MAKVKTNPKLDKLMEETVVVRAVDDGDGVVLQAPINDVRGPYETKIPFEHWAEGLSAKVPSNVKGQLRQLQKTVKDGLVSVQNDVKARPYVYAVSAAGIGFVLGRMFMSARQKAGKFDVSNFRDSPSEHTGVHIRRESRFASGH